MDIWCKVNGYIERKQRINETKARLKSGETYLKVISHRPLWTWRTVDARVYNDRYEHGERSVWDDFLNAFARFSQCFRPMVCFVLCCSFIVYGFLYQWFNIVVVKSFLYFVRSLKLRFSNKKFFWSQIIRWWWQDKKYKRKQHYKQQKNNINNVVLFYTFFIIVS